MRRPVVLMGQSMGGNISQEYLLQHPEEVAALVIIGSTSNTLPITRGERCGLALSRTLMRMMPYRRLTRWMARASVQDPGAGSTCAKPSRRPGGALSSPPGTA
ncbi:alpha/beta fold hydrolase [Streptomyces sp. M10(2022)]